MARVCMRPGCERAAAARLTFDPVSCQAWLDVLVDRPGSAQEVCELHADRLTLPRGWMLCDRRADEPALFVGAAASPATVPSAGPPARTVRRRRRAVASSSQFPLAAAPPAPAAPVTQDLVAPAPEPPERRDDPQPPEPAHRVAPGDLSLAASADPAELRATSPLLARAFRATGDQHSVLTEGARPVRRRARERRLDGD